MRDAFHEPTGVDSKGAPLQDYVSFAGMDPGSAADLLKVLPPKALDDRQNQAPTLGALLRACVQAEGSVRLSGYGIGPQRSDERVSVEALWVSDQDLAEYEISPVHAPGCACRELWRRVSARYDLEAPALPDEVAWRRPWWAEGQAGWWLWWD